jgi:hypothetical protein
MHPAFSWFEPPASRLIGHVRVLVRFLLYSARRNSSLTSLAHDGDEGDGLFRMMRFATAASRPCSNGVTAMKTKLASAFGLAMLAVAFSFSSSFACSETSRTTASVVERLVSESGMNVTGSAEASAPEGQGGEVAAPASVISNIEAPSTDVNVPPAIVSVDAVPVEITETVTVVVPGQKSEDDEGAAIPASGIAGIEPSVTEESSQTAAPESEAKATAGLSAAEAQIEVAEPAAVVAAVAPPSTDVNAPPAIVSVDAVPVEITETVTVVVPGQKSEDIDEVK